MGYTLMFTLVDAIVALGFTTISHIYNAGTSVTASVCMARTIAADSVAECTMDLSGRSSGG